MTRDEMAEACRRASPLFLETKISGESPFAEVATATFNRIGEGCWKASEQLRIDGSLRARLLELVRAWRDEIQVEKNLKCDGWERAVSAYRAVADELEAALADEEAK